MAIDNPLGYLRGDGTSAVVQLTEDMPFLAHFGADLGEPGEYGELPVDGRVFSRGVMGGGLDREVACGIVTEPHRGWMGRPGLSVRRLDGISLSTHFEFQVGSGGGRSNECQVSLFEPTHDISLSVQWKMESSGAINITASLINDADEPLVVDAMRLSFPISERAQDVLTLGGRHAMEAVEHRAKWNREIHTIENRTGRTSHENLGLVFVGTDGFSEQRGEVWGIHFAWSGNYEIVCDGVSHSMKSIHIGELLTPGEVVLQPGETYVMPQIVLAHSTQGLNDVSRKLHREVRRTQDPNTFRPVVLNTWEAVYFNHDLITLKELATQAARVGVERFVLDDGWFHGRRSDTAGLGDWWIDAEVWPDGLSPLIDHVSALGMEFGLWFEPEMVNPDSELFRAHPEWALDGEREFPVLGRHQLVLDFSNEDVRDYIVSRISEMLSNHNISYVKWDHNRPLVGGQAHAQTLGVYEVFARLTQQFPHVQFESCASGGGRIDMGIARFVKRFWASDSIDALDRIAIQRGLSLFMPPEMLGSHIGSPTCHTTGRKHALSFRASTAMFGWLGIEWNLLSLNDRERDGLSKAIGTYKVFRDLLHTGDVFRGDHPDSSVYVHGVIAVDKSEAILSVSRLHSSHTNHTAPVTMQGLDAESKYDIQILPMGTPRWALHRALPEWISNGVVLTGQQLSVLGLHMPALLPESTVLFHISKVES
jgi:alpha-galactosidase